MRIDNLNATVLVEGDYTGVGKTYMAMRLSEDFHNTHSDVLQPFGLDDIFFAAEDAMDFIAKAPRYSCGIFDDAGSAASHRNWFDEVVNILDTTVQTYRFRNLIMFITVPFGIQIDVDLRRLSNFSVVVHDRGYAKVYRVAFQKFANKGRGALYYNHLFNLGSKYDKKLRIPLPSKKLCEEYEKKKDVAFKAKWERDRQTIIARQRQVEWSHLRSRTDDEILNEVIKNIDKYRNKETEKIDKELIQYHAKVGHHRSHKIATLLSEIHDIE